MRTVASAEPEASRPSTDQSTAVTGPACPVRTSDLSPSELQSRIVVSSEPEASRPSADQASVRTGFV